jgi:hypothetical protein
VNQRSAERIPPVDTGISMDWTYSWSYLPYLEYILNTSRHPGIQVLYSQREISQRLCLPTHVHILRVAIKYFHTDSKGHQNDINKDI